MMGAGDATESRVLVVYGIPPSPLLTDGAMRSLGKRFDLRPSNQYSFEAALRRALSKFLKTHVELATARFVFVRNAAELAKAIENNRPTRLIYYGHSLTGGSALFPSIGHSVEPWALINMLRGSSVRDFDILGCNSTSIAAAISVELPGLRVGYLRAAREDNLVVDPNTLKVRDLSFDVQPLYHFPAR
jgi:hypothetical protein